MYKPLYILFFLLIISVGSSKAQNLVYNGDFEIFDTCPVNMSTPSNMEIITTKKETFKGFVQVLRGSYINK